MELIVRRKDRIKVKVYAWEEEGKVNASNLKVEVPDNIAEPKEIMFEFRKPGYADSRDIMGSAQVNNEGDIEDIPGFQDAAIRILLEDWDITDDDGEKLECTPANVNGLAPPVARAAVAGLLAVVSL